MVSDVMDIRGLSKYLKLAPVTIYKMVKEGRIPCRRIGKSIRFPKGMIDRWLDQREHQETPRDIPPMPDAVKKAISKFSNEVREKLGNRVEDIRLYGSFARGEGRIDSDIDMAVMVDRKEVGVTRTISEIAARMSLEADKLISVTILESDSHKKGLRESYPFHVKVHEEGISL